MLCSAGKCAVWNLAFIEYLRGVTCVSLSISCFVFTARMSRASSYEIVTDSNVRIVPRGNKRRREERICLDNPDDGYDAVGNAQRTGAPVPAPTGKDMRITNLPTPFSFDLDWADIPPASQFAIIGLMTAVPPPRS